MMENCDNDNIVLLNTYVSDVAANIALGVLRTNGIPCILDGEIVAGVFGIQLTPNDGIRLMVRQCDLEEARRILRTE